MKSNTRNISIGSVLACSALLACKATTSAQCLSTSSTTVKLAPEASIVQGGYIHFGDKSCSAMFEIIDVTADKINLKAFSARHCRFENGLQLDQVKVSLFVDGNSKRSAGYIKNVPAEESFVTRATTAVSEIGKLNMPDVTGRFLDALRIPTQYDPWGTAVFSDNAESIKEPGEASDSSLICNNTDLFPPLTDYQQALTESCWSFLDLGTFDLTIRKTAVSSKVFSALTDELMQKQKRFTETLAKNVSLKSDYQLHKKRIDDVMALLRIQKAARLAYLLNFDLCTPAFKRDDLCKNQKRLIEIMGQNFKEPNENGTSTNIFDWVAAAKNLDGSPLGALTFSELLAGKRMQTTPAPRSFADAEQIADALGSEFNSNLKDKTVITIGQLRNMLGVHSKPASNDELSPALSLGTNFSTRMGSGSVTQQFAMLNLRDIFSDTKKVRLIGTAGQSVDQEIYGISRYGTLRMASPKENQLVKFQPTDSGSLLMLKGIVPLMVLNTVDGVGTSGGSAILALPQAEDNEEVISRTARKTEPANRGNATATVEITNGGFGNGVNTACR